jgi:hypothetical protein
MIANPPAQHRVAALAGVLERRADDRGIRDTLRGQIGRDNAAAQTVVNRVSAHRFPDVYCWCQAVIVRSTWDRIAAGLTESCGAPGCDEDSSNFSHK